jgi:uncharacterized membrane protein YeiH
MLVAAAEVVRAPIAVDLLAVAVGAMFGALLAVRRGFDALGLAALALLGGLGGGVIRDVLLNLRPVALTNAAYIPTALVVAAIGFFFAAEVKRRARVLDLLDAAAMGLYGVAGASQALRAGVGPGGAIVVGLIAAVAGGVLCDIASARPVSIFLPGPLHATAPLVGAAAYVGLDRLDVAGAAAAALGIGVTFGVRVLGLRRDVHAPLPRDRDELLTDEHLLPK